MGKSRKKKNRNDARGYGNNAPTATTKPTGRSNDMVVTQRTHDGIKSLVDQMRLSEGDSTISHNSAISSTAISNSESTIRFVPKLTKIVDRLMDLGFQYDVDLDDPNTNSAVSKKYLEEMVLDLGYGITLESALDWLCLNVPTLDLPPLFTDGNLRNNQIQEEQRNGGEGKESPSSLTVLKVASMSGPNFSIQNVDVRKENDELVSKSQEEEEGFQRLRRAQEEKRIAREKEDREAREAEKKRLLDQYAYQEDEAEVVDENEMIDAESSVDAKEVLMSPQEVELREKEAELAELEADLGCEANNYMRSKQEMKILRNQLKKLKQQVTGLSRRVENQKRKLEAEKEREGVEKEEEESKKENGDDVGGDFFGTGFFDQHDETEDEIVDIPKNSSQKALLDCHIPKGWTGSTPRKTLEEICRKQRLGKPKFLNLGGRRGYKLSGINLKKLKSNKQGSTYISTEEWVALEVDFVRGSSLPDYLALKALYDIDSNKPLYGLFPPAFRSIWLSWIEEVQNVKEKAQEEVEIKRQARVQHLLAIIEGQHKLTLDDTIASPKTPMLGIETSNRKEIIEDTWEDRDSNDLECNKVVSTTSSKGETLKLEFLARRSTKSYVELFQQRSSLPMTNYRKQVLKAICTNQVTILCAETGAGKTTQCPQYVLEEALLEGRGDQVNILCTQPRRVAATSVAERVAEEMNDTIGNQIGYQIRMEAKRSKNTKLLFCTTGVVLRRLQDDNNLSPITHIIVDEVHERQVQTDVLLIALRQLLRTTRRDLKVILMSATLDSDLFSSFFNQAPVIKVPGRTFPVHNYYLEDLLDATGHIIEEGSQHAFREYHNFEKTTLWVSSQGGEKRREVVDLGIPSTELSGLYAEYTMSTRLSMERVDESILNYDLIEDVLQLLLIEPERNTTLHAPNGVDTSNGSVLVFLPGIGEIRSLMDRLVSNRKLGDRSRFCIIPLHSKLSSSDQRKAFLPVKAGCRKIILSTNIAETSVTIQDVVVVIDCGREREVRRNKRSSTSILVTDWCSKANTKQRAGRAGRVQPGLCLKLFSSATAEAMKNTSEPELKRVPLEEVCLTILASGLGRSCEAFLRQAPQPPSDDSIQAALTVLEEVGAITLERDSLTPLGEHLAKLPVDVRLGKMLVLGSLFRCLDKVLTIAASLSSKSPFATYLQEAESAKAKHKQFEDPNSDFATLCNVWEGYNRAKSQSSKAGRMFCQSNFLNAASLHEITTARKDFLNLLGGIGFVGKSAVGKGWETEEINRNSENWTLVHAIVFAGLNPNVARLDEVGHRSYELWTKNRQQIYFHRTSVNASKKRFLEDQNWVVFFEKFGTPNRISISTTCFVNSVPLLLFGGPLVVKHTDRLVIVDNWMEIKMAAQVAVMMKELRKQVDGLLLKLVAHGNEKQSYQGETIDSIVEIICNASTRYKYL